MIGRRGALYNFGFAILGGAWTLISCSPLRRQRTNGDGQARAPATASGDELGDQVLKDLTRLGSRVYSEEGIAVFLACENLVRGGDGAPVVLPAPEPLNTALAATFRRYAEVLPRVRPNVTEGDVAKLVELLAERDFAAGGKGFTP